MREDEIKTFFSLFLIDRTVFQKNDSKNVLNNYSLYMKEMNDKKWERKVRNIWLL